VNCEEMIKVSNFCDLQVCGFGQATWFVSLLALSHVCRGELCMLFGLNA
jgi:hypothetical protein